MTQTTLQAQLEPIARAYRQFQLWRGLTVCWIGASLAAAAALVVFRWTGWWASIVIPVLALATGVAVVVVWWRSRQNAPALRWIAQQIERENPKLQSLLLAAVQQQPDESGELNYLQERVVLEALAANEKHPWVQKHIERVFFAQCSQWFALAVLLGLAVALTSVAPRGRSLLGVALGVKVTPGDTTIERGSSLVVLARFNERLPARATLVVNSAAEQTRRIPLAKNLEDPVFGGSLPEVPSDLTYHVEYDELKTPEYKVKVFDFPALRRADADLTYPKYTGLPEKKIEDTRRISAVEGTLLNYSFQLNKAVASAKLIAKDKSSVSLVPDVAHTNVYVAKMTLEQSRHYELQLIDDAGRTNKTPTDIVINVLPNRQPELKLISPRRDIRVSPLEEVTLQAQVSDDFGVGAYGIAYTMAGQETKFVELGKSAPPLEKRNLEYLLSLEALSAQVDQLLTYYVWADDLGPDGQTRRTSSDMYFAEVRPFEEIFREGQQPPSGESEQQQNSQGSQTERLAELQKEIINATWKLQRRETGAKPTEAYPKDAVVVKESQEKALEQANEMKSRLEDNPRFKPLIESVVKEMERAVTQLSDAADKNTVKPLPTALNAEQSAYQALLKLQAREYEVTRSRNRSQRGSSANQRAQQQLDQLELKQSENRYETERQASSQQNPEQREQLQVLNRLKELAQRQQDLNNRLKELQTALQEAKTEEERDAVRRQLKRLREEEQQMLADVDELRQRMDRQENQSQMAESRQQLDQTRNEVRRASEELDKDAVSQALASGTRAQRQLQELREDFRKKTSNQFSDDMRQMRSDARQLVQKEEEIGQKLDTMTDSQRKTLSDSEERAQLAQQLDQQRSGMTNLLNNMRRVTEQAENAEPLLAKQLYDTIRRTDQGKFNGAITNSSELLRRGFVPQASQLEQQTRPILNDLKQGVERAAESVLGDEAEALRLARNILDELSQELENEIARSDTNLLASAQSESTPSGQSRNGRSNRNNPSQGGQNQSGQAGQQGDQQAPQTDANQPGSAQSQNQQANAQQNGNRSGRSGQNAGRSPGTQQQRNGDQASAAQNGEQQSSAEQTAQNAQGQQGQQGQRGGQQGGGQQGGGNQPGNPQQASNQQNPPQPRSLSGQRGANGPRTAQNQGRGQRGGLQNFFDGGAAGQGGGTSGPLTGNTYTEWSDRLRDVEELVDNPEIRSRVAQIRDRARGVRAEFKRHSVEPQWPMVRNQIATPLVEVRNRVSEELARRTSDEALVPIDRDPVPTKYSELVRRYYEKLGSSE